MVTEVVIDYAFIRYSPQPQYFKNRNIDVACLGDLTPAQALDLISTQNYVMIDIRSEKDKDRAGVPRLPSSAKNRMVAIP